MIFECVSNDSVLAQLPKLISKHCRRHDHFGLVCEQPNGALFEQATTPFLSTTTPFLSTTLGTLPWKQDGSFSMDPRWGPAVNCFITTDSAVSLSEKNQWKHWENIINEIPALNAEIQAGNSYIPRVPHYEPLDPSLVRRIATVDFDVATKV